MVVSAWQCPHLTSLRIESAPGLGLSESHVGAARCTGLRQLLLECCTFDDLVFPGAMGSALRQLSSLAFLGSDYFRASREFSLLRCAEQRAHAMQARWEVCTFASKYLLPITCRCHTQAGHAHQWASPIRACVAVLCSSMLLLGLPPVGCISPKRYALLCLQLAAAAGDRRWLR